MTDRIFRSTSSRIAYYVVATTLYAGIAGSFDMAFTLRLTGSFRSLALLYLLYYASLAATFVISTFLVSSGRFSRGFRFNLAFQACLGLLVFFLLPAKDRAAILLPYYLLKGVADGFFWSTRHAALSCLTGDGHRDRFLLSVQVGSVVVSVLMPALSALFMRLNSVSAGYAGVYLAAGIVACLAAIAGPRIATASLPRPDLRKIGRFFAGRDTLAWRAYLFCNTVNGTLALFCAAILNVGVLRTEFNLGIYTSLVALLSAAFMLSVRRRIAGRRISRISFVMAGSAGSILGRFAYAAFLSVPALGFKAFCDSFLCPLNSIFAENIIRSRSDRMASGGAFTPLEPYLFQEIFILFARAFAFTACAVVFSAFPVGTFAAARILLLVLSAAPVLDVVLLRAIEKENLHKMTDRVTFV